MKKFDKLVKEIAKEVREEMHYSIECGLDRMSYEHDLIDCTIMIECHRVRCVNGMVISDYDVWVARDNEEHKNPNVINTIRQALPEWYEVERQYEEEQAEFKREEEYMLNY